MKKKIFVTVAVALLLTCGSLLATALKADNYTKDTILSDEFENSIVSSSTWILGSKGSSNQAPNKPSTPDGPTSGKIGVEYTYTTSTTDPDGDEIYYHFLWGDETVGLFLNDERAFEGYTLLAPKHYTTTYLINNDGLLCHSWESNYEPGQSVYLLENGHLLRACFIKEGGLTGGGEGGRIEEYDWDGNLVWEFDYSTDQYVSHHDIEPLPNGNVLVLAVEKKSYNDVIAAGFNPDMLHPEVQQKGYLLPDYVIEVEPTGSSGGNIVWEWHVWDHLIQDYDPSKENYGVVADHPDLIDVHGSGGNIRPFWNHMNSIDYNEEFDQIILSVRGNDEIWIIDHSTTTEEAAGHTGGNSGKGGDLLYRWGNPQTYDAGNANDQKLFEQHDAQWIETDCPGEGNILIFNNGNNRPGGSYSSVDEIVPPVDSNGNYGYTSGSPYAPEDPIWVYTAENPTDLFSEAISGAHRLPNGNTLIDDGVHGTIFEVTPEKEIVWLYVNPVINTGPLNQGDSIPLDPREHQYNAVFKIQRYAPDYPGLMDKDLTPGDPIEKYPNSDGGWLGPVNSGEEASASHIWDTRGIYEIKVKAKDINGAQSEWSNPLSISMPRNRAITTLFLQFLDGFPLLQKVLLYLIK